VTGKSYQGLAVGVDATGALVLETNGDQISLSAVDVEYLR
jgi:biotin-(acetyl-CoA carboxylase) ligase